MGRRLLLGALEFLGLANLVLAHPVLQILETYPELLIARHFRFLETFSVAALLCLLIPATIYLIVLIPHFCGLVRLARTLHAVLICILLFLLGLLVMKQLGLNYAGDWQVLLCAIIFAATGAFLYLRWKRAASFLQMLAPAALIVPVLFLINPSIQRLYSSAKIEPFPKIRSRASVVFVIFDEFSGMSLRGANGEIDKVRFPNFAALLKNFTWYRNASTVADETVNAVPAILTGRFPQKGKKPHLVDYPENLFTLAAPSYNLKVFESATDLCPHLSYAGVDRFEFAGVLADLLAIYLQLIAPSGFASALPTVGGAWGHFWGTPIESKLGTQQIFRQFLDSIGNDSSPTLLFLHIQSPHMPWYLLPSGRRYDFERLGYFGNPVVTAKYDWTDDYWPVVSSLQRYLLQIGYIDRFAGELVKQLSDTGKFDSSLIILTADHGVSIWPGDNARALKQTNSGDILNVPLFIKLPNQRVGSIDDRNVESVDILPTIAEVLGVRLNWRTDGMSLLNPTISGRKVKKALNFMNGTGEMMTFPPTMGPSRILKLESDLDFLGEPMERMFDAGPVQGLVGQTLDQLSPQVTDDYRIQVNSPELYRSVRLASGFNPILVSGRVYSHTKGPLIIAIAINGTVHASTQTFSETLSIGKGFGVLSNPDAARYPQVQCFVAMVPEDSIRDGHNEVRVVLVDSENGKTYLPSQND